MPSTSHAPGDRLPGVGFLGRLIRDTRARAGGALAAAALALAPASLTAGGCSTDVPPTKLQGQVHLTLIHTSDIHSRLFPYNVKLGQVDAGLGLGTADQIANIGGVARMSHIVGRERARSGRVLHIDGGDCFQGAPVFNFFQGEAEIQALSAMGVDAMLIANHEFDTGARNLRNQLQKWATFPALAANYKLEDSSQPGASELGTVFKPYHIADVDGLRVAIIGMANLSSITSIFDAPNRLGITPLKTSEVGQFYIDQLRPLVDVVGVISHLGLENDEELIENTTGLDVILGGHNHIVLQPPKRVNDCSRLYDEKEQSYFITLNGAAAADPDAGCSTEADCPAPGYCEGSDAAREAGEGVCRVKRFCRPREVVLAHSGAFAKYVGRLDMILSNDEKDFDEGQYDPINGFELVSESFQLFPINETVPEDPIVSRVLEPYAQGLDNLANLELLVGYAPDGSRRSAAGGGDSPLGNLVATAMWLRLGVQTDFSLTNSTGIRADLVPGAITVEQMYNIFPFDNAISKMQLSGVEVQQLFDFVARRSAGRGCVSQVQIAGARIVMDCAKLPEEDGGENRGAPGVATGIYIGASTTQCDSDEDCPGEGIGSCDNNVGLCWNPIEPFGYYELATSDYLAGGGSGFRVLQRNTTQNNTRVQQRDALLDYIAAGDACGSSSAGELRTCSADADCGCNEGGDPDLCGVEYVCACPEGVEESSQCISNSNGCPGDTGQCVLAACRRDVATFTRETCANAPNDDIADKCKTAILPCASGGEQCKFLACVDNRIGNFSDGRIRPVGQ
jgi:5'-nucleotidase/UDP-sugar diphosphatase